MNPVTPDAGIPVLTEIIPVAAPAPAPRPEEPVAPQPAVEDRAALEARAASQWDKEKWNRMEQEIRERILSQVLQRIDTVLEQRVRDSLADVLQTAVDDLATQLKSGLRQSIRDLVERAVSQEIRDLQAARSNRSDA